MFKGIYTALISPFSGGELDVTSLKKLVEHQVEGGIDGFVINGTTAESPCIDWVDVEKSVNAVREVTEDHPIIIGAGNNSTAKTIELSKKAETFDPKALLIVVPYYNKPTQEGMYQHYKAIHDNTKTPIILYNVPGRTVVSMKPETCHRLSQLERIVSMKDATGDMAYLEKERSLCAEDFSLLAGEDPAFVDFILNGGDGCISVMSHIFPDKMKVWYEQARNNDKSCIAEFKKYKNLCSLLFKEPNPVPVKYALYKMGIIADYEVRLPLVKCSEDLQKEIDQELRNLELI